MKKILSALITVAILLSLTACAGTVTDTSTQESSTEDSKQTEIVSSKSDEADENRADSIQTDDSDYEMENKNNMVIVLGNREYSVQIEDSVTERDIMENLPLDLTMTQFGNHEYYSELDFRPEFAEKRTSQIQAGHIYYWDGWNAFVINYIDWDISPYEVVHIGEITDKSIVDELLQTDGDITVAVKEMEDLK